MGERVKAFVIPNDPRVLAAVEAWLESENMVMVIAYPRSQPAPIPTPDPVNPPTPPPPLTLFPVGARVRVRYNGALYYDPDTEKFYTRDLVHTQYTILELRGGWRKLKSFPPFNIWTGTENLEAE